METTENTETRTYNPKPDGKKLLARQKKIDSLKGRIQSGEYRVSSRSVARALLLNF